MRKKLRFYYGPMGSAKSMRLMTMAFNLDEKGIPSLTLKPATDTRDGQGIIHSRVGISRPCITFGVYDDLLKLVKETSEKTGTKYQWVFVDECQFLSEEQVDQLSDVVDELDIDVACFGLRTDFKSKLFSGSKRLFEIADTIEELKSRCSCGEKASINARIDKDGNVMINGPQTLVGGDDRYTAMCRKCWKRQTRK
jgi:thymidine kinase